MGMLTTARLQGKGANPARPHKTGQNFGADQLVFSRVKSAMEAINKNERLFARALRLDISSPDTISFATFQKKRLFSD